MREGSEVVLSEDAMGGVEKRGEENLKNNTPATKTLFWTCPSSGMFPQPFGCCCSVLQIPNSAGQKLFWKSPECILRRSLVRFPSPHAPELHDTKAIRIRIRIVQGKRAAKCAKTRPSEMKD